MFFLFFYENIWALLRKNLSLWLLTELDSNQHAKLQRLARIFIFCKLKQVEVLYCSKSNSKCPNLTAQQMHRLICPFLFTCDSQVFMQ